MFSYLKGKIIEKQKNKIILETAGIGWEILVSSEALKNLPQAGKEAKILVYQVFKDQENIFELYGFAFEEEKNLFLLLISVDKIGPKTALNILSAGSFDKLISAIQHEKTEFLSKLPGIGAKTASRIIFELSKKIKSGKLSADFLDTDLQVEEALESLGFAQKEIKTALVKLSPKIEGINERVAEALKILSGKRAN